jgi:hemoglobin-like flavoprotein
MDTKVLKDTFARARVENGGLTRLGMSFYARLFEKYPSVIPLFNTPPEEQHKKLMASIGSIITAVENPAQLMPFLHAMGIRHLKYKTESAHYAAVAENLIAVLGDHLSREGDWTESMKKTWQEALEIVSSVMIEAADNPSKFAAELKAAGYNPDGFRTHDSEPWKLLEAASSS